jgi:hypothetical protein
MASGTLRVFRAWFLVCLPATLLLAAPAEAEQIEGERHVAQVAQGGGAAGSVSSTLFHRLPEGFPVEVIGFDDSELNVGIRERFIEELSKAGYLTAEDAPLELSFETEVITGSLPSAKPSLGRIGASSEAEAGDRGSRTGVDVEINVWSNTQDSVLGGRKPESGGSETLYRLTAQLRDRDTGRVLWQGEAVCEMTTADRGRLARAMVPPLVGTYGQSVKGHAFRLE